MTEPAQQRPVPGPPRPAPGPVPTAAPTAVAPDGSPFAGLADLPVADHVAVYEAEHERLQRDLSTIDQL